MRFRLAVLNEIVDVVLSNHFRKQNGTKRKFQAKTCFFCFFFNDEKMFINDFFKLKNILGKVKIFGFLPNHKYFE